MGDDRKPDTMMEEMNAMAAANPEEIEAANLADTEAAIDTEAEDEENDQEDSLIIKFAKPYKFEGKEYTEVDLSGLEDTTAGILQSVGRILAKKSPGLNPATVEMTLEYAELLANRVTKLPVEFFKRLPAKEAIKLKTTVVGFLYGGDGDN